MNFQDDTDYIPTLKIVIRGAVFTVSDSVAKEQVQQELLSYARNLYLQFWLENESDASAVTTDHLYDEGLFWFDYIYEHGCFPE